MLYFTSDLHFGHSNVIRHCSRPFRFVEEMDAALISNWNKKVSEQDSVYIVGDLMFRNKIPPAEYLSQLKGKKHLIVGNHDRSWMKRCPLDEYFESVTPMAFISDGQHKITLCHYPMMDWPFSSRSYMIFGHIHNNTDDAYWPLIQKSERMLNAGVDINGFEPVTFSELVANNKRHKELTGQREVEL